MDVFLGGDFALDGVAAAFFGEAEGCLGEGDFALLYGMMTNLHCDHSYF